MVAVLAFGTAACSSDDYAITEQPENPTEKTYTMTIQASKGDDATMRGLYFADGENSKDLRVNWNGKEKVRVVQNGAVIGTLSAALSSTESTTLTGTVTGFQVNQAIGFYLLADENGKMDYTGQKGAMLDDNGTGNIEENYDFASYELTGPQCMEAFTTDGSSIVPKDGVYIPFTSHQAIVRFELQKSDGAYLFATKFIVTDKNTGKLVQSIDAKSGTKTYGQVALTTTNSTSCVYYAALNFNGASDIRLFAQAKDEYGNPELYIYEKENVTFTKGQYYRVKVKMRRCTKFPLSQITHEDTQFTGWYIGSIISDGDTENCAYNSGGSGVNAVIAYVGKVPGYFDNFLAMAMHDIKKDGSEEGREFMSWSEALTAIGSFATAHPIVIGSTTYNTASNTAYDEVDDNTASASNTSNSTRKGWRIPSVTDWRYIFYGLCGEPSPTNPAGITEGVAYGSSALLTKLNDEQNADLRGTGWYCTSSAVSGANDYRWMIQLSYVPDFEKSSITYTCLRPVFAY